MIDIATYCYDTINIDTYRYDTISIASYHSDTTYDCPTGAPLSLLSGSLRRWGRRWSQGVARPCHITVGQGDRQAIARLLRLCLHCHCRAWTLRLSLDLWS